MWPIIIVCYFMIAAFTSAWTVLSDLSDPWEDTHILIGLWWPFLLAKEIWKSFKMHVLEK